jgi:6,7-dimethyl-8-ribityllumazine synthase
MDGEKQATLEQQYTYHTPGSVQEPGAEEKVVFAHMLPENADKWKGTNIQHVGDTPAGRPCKRLAVVIGEFHDQLMNACLDDARLSAEAMGSKVTDVVWVPGTYEAPLVVRNLLKRDDIDAVVIVGYIEKGSTLHGEEMGSTCSPIFKGLELEFNKPVGMGIIGPGATAEQAASRVAYAGNATRAAIRMCHYMDSVRLA